MAKLLITIIYLFLKDDVMDELRIVAEVSKSVPVPNVRLLDSHCLKLNIRNVYFLIKYTVPDVSRSTI